MLGPFSQSLYSTVLDEKSDNLLPFFLQTCSTESGSHQQDYYSATVTK